MSYRPVQLAVFLLLGVTLSASADESTPTALEAAARQAIREARTLARSELGALRAEMRALRMRGEVVDCGRILERCLDPGARGTTGGQVSRWPGEETYFTRVLDRFGAVGSKLSVAYGKILPLLADDVQRAERYESLVGWLGTFPEIAARLKHFNLRRKECRMGPVTCSFAASYGGFRHARYLHINRGHPTLQTMSPHTESPDLPGYSAEGAWGAHALGGDGWFDDWMGSVYHRDPVFDPCLARIAFGGLGASWWCRRLGGSNKCQTDLLTWPADGATRIRPDFAGESPNPLPEGLRHCGTLIVVQFLRGEPRNFRYRLLDRKGREIRELLVFGRGPAHVFASRKRLHWGTYTVQLMGTNFWYEFSFNTEGA